ncbi:hypothetical protein L9F63_014082, partial [Diploptera punctata]
SGFNHFAHKEAVFNSLTYRLVNIPISKENYENEKEYIINVAIENGFEENMVHKKINKCKRQKIINESRLIKQTEENVKFKKVTYHPLKHHKFQNIFEKFNIRLTPKNEYSLDRLIKTNKNFKKLRRKQIRNLSDQMQGL